VLLWLRANGCPSDEKELHRAVAEEGREKMVKVLIEAGADVNKAKDDGETPLVIAALNGHTAIGQILSDAGAV